jgi:hypothetical protein
MINLKKFSDSVLQVPLSVISRLINIHDPDPRFPCLGHGIKIITKNWNNPELWYLSIQDSKELLKRIENLQPKYKSLLEKIKNKTLKDDTERRNALIKYIGSEVTCLGYIEKYGCVTNPDGSQTTTMLVTHLYTFDDGEKLSDHVWIRSNNPQLPKENQWLKFKATVTRYYKYCVDEYGNKSDKRNYDYTFKNSHSYEIQTMKEMREWKARIIKRRKSQQL